MTDHVMVDTGPIVAILNPDDPHHTRCVDAVEHMPLPMLSCWAVLAEAAYLLRRVPDGLGLLMRFCDTAVEIVHPDPGIMQWVAEFASKYADREVQLADATLMYLAERHGMSTIFTLDRRDFGVYRFADGAAPKLIPEA